MTTISFDAPDRRMSLNDREHWRVKAKRTKNWRTAAFIAALNAGTRNVGPSIVQVTFSVGRNVKRDPHNNAPCIKAIVDGITDAGAWPDDDSRYVAIVDPKFIKRPGQRVDVELIPFTPTEITGLTVHDESEML